MSDERTSVVEAEREPNFLPRSHRRRRSDRRDRDRPRALPLHALLAIGTLIVVAYLILSINVYLESQAFGRFSIGYGLIGPTEMRLILIALNTALVLGGGLDFTLAEVDLTVLDVIGLTIAGGMIVMLVGRALRNLRELAEAEPAASRRG